MKKLFALSLSLVFLLHFSFAQFDTIAGPFQGSGALEGEGDFLYVPAVIEGGYQVLQVDVTKPTIPPKVVYTHPFPTGLSDILLVDDVLYVAGLAETLSAGGRIYRVSDLDSNNPTTELLVELPWLPSSMEVKGNTMYISQFFFTGSDVFTIDLADPASEANLLFDTDNNNIGALLFNEDILLYKDRSLGAVRAFDLSSNSSPISYVSNLDNPNGIDISEDKLYVSVANDNSNFSSRIKVYDIGNFNPIFIEDIATTTAQFIGEVRVLDSGIYLVESSIDPEDCYLLRIKELATSNSQIDLQSFQIFPNPSNGLINISNIESSYISVYNSAGAKVLSVTDGRQQLDLTNFPNGVYSILVYKENVPALQSRIVIQK